MKHWLTVCAMALAAPACSLADGIELPDPPSKSIPREYFGMHFHRADRGTSWPGRQIGSWRLWDAGVAWIDLEAEPGRWRFERLDRYVAMAQLAKVELLYPFGLTPTWASARPSEKGPYRLGDAAEPRDLSDWTAYVREVAVRYKSRIRYYEIWNEVNAGAGFFTGTPQAMVALQKAAYETLKAVDPNAILASASSVGQVDHQLQWFENYLALGGGRHADVIAYHLYQPKNRPEEMMVLTRRLKDIMKRQGIGDKPLWNTESGYRLDPVERKSAIAPDWPALGPLGPAYVARALTLGWLAGVERFYWYAWDNAELGFVDGNGQVTASGRAYLTTSTWLSDAVMSKCRQDRALWSCTLTRQGEPALLTWRADDKLVSSAVPAGYAGGTAWRLDGSAQPISGSRVLDIGAEPMLLTSPQAVRWVFGESGATR